MSKLVIVESPAKSRTIEQYLGKEYKVAATMGHIRDLPKKEKAVDVEHDFSLVYEPIPGKGEVIKKLKDVARKSEVVILATDPDREGEAISWHVKELLGLPDDKLLRVTFNEITKKEILRSMANPKGIDYPLVDSQQARRALDRILGYEISPILWRKIKRGLSAGRVQSVAVRIVVDREDEIRAFVPQEYWTIEVSLGRKEGYGTFTAQYFAPCGEKKTVIPNEETALEIIKSIEQAPFTVHSVKNSEKKRNPAPPFITSTLQQEASRKLGMTSKRTMAVAQQLYEGVQIEGHGLAGLITYMRTDSLRLSDDAVTDAREFIRSRYGKEYLPAQARKFKSKKSAQDAHEAIRPSYIELPPEAVKGSLSNEQYRLYKLIWDRFIACQMSVAVYNILTIDTLSAGHIFRANHTTLVFAGFTAIYEEGKDEEDEAAGDSLPKLTPGEGLVRLKTIHEQHFTKPPARYSEATLIRAMEEQGIGRPSTYAPTLSTIVDREYVVRENKQLRPTPLGETVTEYMKKQFAKIVDITFTAHMEESLDEVEQGKNDWRAMLRGFYDEFSKIRELAEADIQNGRIRIPDEPTDQICDLCNKPMAIKSGRFGRYIACTGYPECKNTRNLSEPTDGFCPLCDSQVLKKKSKKGYSYYGCEKTGCTFMTWDTPQKTNCSECGKSLFRVRYAKVPICENPLCSAFVPEDARGYKRKEDKEDSKGDKAKKSASSGKTPAKKSAAKKKSSKT
ncbi:MAG: type I DNA topoisomerase [Oscillospiraceae bacterium]|nr:type I DNA topoisomerase [Oscillospiraceae bacterium]